MLKLKGLSAKNGFLLLEVLVSVVVITLGLVYIVRSFSISTRAIKTSRNYMKAVSLLEEKLWELEEAGQVERGEDGDYFKDDRGFQWELAADTEEELPINKTILAVTWKDRQRKQRVSIATYLWNEED